MKTLVVAVVVVVVAVCVMSACGAHESARVMSRRRRDSTEIGATERNRIVSLHNKLRAQEGAADMETMEWDDYLASMAADWAAGCSFSHGQPTRDLDTMPYQQVGQNLAASSWSALNISQSIQNFYDEKKFYTFDMRKCTKVCGHYTQVVWSTSRAVGCALQYCEPLKETTFVSGTILVCNYGPAGNYPRQPYKKGAACSQCASGDGWCHNGLCRRGCSGPGPTCECKQTCAVCGTLNAQTCKCACKAGWTGNDCAARCRDLSDTCNKGWPPSWCTSQYQYVLDNCPLMCGKCKADDGSCDGKPLSTTTGAEQQTTAAPPSAEQQTTAAPPSAEQQTTAAPPSAASARLGLLSAWIIALLCAAPFITWTH